MWLSAIVGPVTYGLVTWLTDNDHRLAMMVTGLYFVAGLLEIGWAVGLKYTAGFTRPLPTVLTVLSMAASLALLGLALRTLPRIEMVFVNAPWDVDESTFNRKLFLARRRSEQQLRVPVPDFYVVTLSPHAIGYKGMVLPDKLAVFFADLQRAELASSAVVFHQRFSTNTLPRWPLAHPFRLLAHNGEINTIEGNRRWAQARSKVWKTPRFDIGEFDPVISMHGSDSQSLDNMLELLVAAAWS